MKIWILSVDDEHATWAKAFADKESAEEYFAETVSDYWERYFPGDDMPEDAHKAWDKITCESDCVDTISIDEDEFELPAVYEAGPELLSALAAADEFLQGWYDDDMQEGMDELQGCVESAMAKANGEIPQPWALQAAAGTMLAALHEIRDNLDPEATGNAELYADIFEIIDKAIAAAEGK